MKKFIGLGAFLFFAAWGYLFTRPPRSPDEPSGRGHWPAAEEDIRDRQLSTRRHSADWRPPPRPPLGNIPRGPWTDPDYVPPPQPNAQDLPNLDEDPPMKGSPEEVREKKAKYDHLIELIRQRALEGREDLADSLVEEAKALFDPLEESWWIRRIDDERTRAFLVREGDETGFFDDPYRTQYRIFNHMTPMEWCHVLGPSSVVKDGVTLTAPVLELYMGARDKDGTLGEEEVRYLADLVTSRQGQWAVAERLLAYSSHVSAWDFLVREVSRISPGPDADDTYESPAADFEEKATLLGKLANRGLLRETDRAALESAYRAWEGWERGTTDRDARDRVLDARDPLMEAIVHLTPKDDHAFLYAVIRSEASGPERPYGESGRLVGHALDGLDGSQAADYDFLVGIIDSAMYPGARAQEQALLRLARTVTDPWESEPAGKMRDLLMRWGNDHPSAAVRLEAIRDLEGYSCTDSVQWLDQLRAWSTGHRDEEVRKWAALALKMSLPFEPSYRRRDQERAQSRSK